MPKTLVNWHRAVAGAARSKGSVSLFAQAEVNELDTQLHSERRGRDALVQAKDEAHAARQDAEQRAADLELRAAEAQSDAAAAHEQRCALAFAVHTRFLTCKGEHVSRSASVPYHLDIKQQKARLMWAQYTKFTVYPQVLTLQGKAQGGCPGRGRHGGGAGARRGAAHG